MKYSQINSSRLLQKGAASLVLAATLLLLSGSLLGTYYLVTENKAQVLENQGQVDALDEAIANINGYALAHGHLPCVARVQDGEADCSAGQKGWYPAKTLEAEIPPDELKGNTRTTKGIRYALSSRLMPAGVAVDRYQPISPILKSYPTVRSSLDFCEAMRSLALPPGGGRWTTGDGFKDNAADKSLLNVLLNKKDPINIVYAVSALPPGPAGAEWGDMTDLDKVAREATLNPEGFRSTVRYMDAPSLFLTFACDSALMSLDGMADAAMWSQLATTARTQLEHDADHFAKVESVTGLATAEDVRIITDLGVQGEYYAWNGAFKLALYTGTLNVLGVAAAKVTLAASLLVISNTAGATLALATIAGGEVANTILLQEYKKRAKNAPVWQDAQEVIEAADREGIKP